MTRPNNQGQRAARQHDVHEHPQAQRAEQPVEEAGAPQDPGPGPRCQTAREQGEPDHERQRRTGKQTDGSGDPISSRGRGREEVRIHPAKTNQRGADDCGSDGAPFGSRGSQPRGDRNQQDRQRAQEDSVERIAVREGKGARRRHRRGEQDAGAPARRPPSKPQREDSHQRDGVPRDGDREAFVGDHREIGQDVRRARHDAPLSRSGGAGRGSAG
jgi:hypothetical protein